MPGWQPFAIAFVPNTAGGDNCGTGSGGFKPGNKCGGGGKGGKITKEEPSSGGKEQESAERPNRFNQAVEGVMNGLANAWDTMMDYPFLLGGFNALQAICPPAVRQALQMASGVGMARWLDQRTKSKPTSRLKANATPDSDTFSDFASDIIRAAAHLCQAAGAHIQLPTLGQVKQLILRHVHSNGT